MSLTSLWQSVIPYLIKTQSQFQSVNQLHNIKFPLKSRIYEQIAKYLTADNSVVHNSNANDMCVTQDLNSFGEIWLLF
jgi:uncharacterized protein YaiI (UPF0178 family)